MIGQTLAEQAKSLLTSASEEEEKRKKKQVAADKAKQLLLQTQPAALPVRPSAQALEAPEKPSAGQIALDTLKETGKDIVGIGKGVGKVAAHTMGQLISFPVGLATKAIMQVKGMDPEAAALIPEEFQQIISEKYLPKLKGKHEEGALGAVMAPFETFTHLINGLTKSTKNVLDVQLGIDINDEYIRTFWEAGILTIPALKGYIKGKMQAKQSIRMDTVKRLLEKGKKDLPPETQKIIEQIPDDMKIDLGEKFVEETIKSVAERAKESKVRVTSEADLKTLPEPMQEALRGVAERTKAAEGVSEVGPLTYDAEMAAKVTENLAKKIPEHKWEPGVSQWAREQTMASHEGATVEFVKNTSKEAIKIQETEKTYGKEVASKEQPPGMLDEMTKELESRILREPPEEPDIGLRIKQEKLAPTKEKIEYHKYDDAIQEQAYQDSFGIKKAPAHIRAGEVLSEIKKSFTRSFKDLPAGERFAKAKAWLRQSQHQQAVNFDKGLHAIRGWIFRKNKNLQNIFGRKVYLDDLFEEYRADPEAFATGEKILPDRFTPETLAKEQAKFHSLATDKYPQVGEAIATRNNYLEALRNELIVDKRALGIDIESRFTKQNYFRHQILERSQKVTGVKGTGGKVARWRSWLSKRGMSKDLPYNKDYIQAEAEVIGEMLYDSAIAKIHKKILDVYDVSADTLAKAKEMKLENWRDAIPEGYATYQVLEGNVFYSGFTVPERVALELQTGVLDGLIGDITAGKKVVNDALVMGGRYKEYVLPEELALTLYKISKQRIKPRGVAAKFFTGLQRKWKIWALISPRRFWKYNARNMTGDADWAAIGNPRGFTRAPVAFRELFEALYQKKPPSARLREWMDQGGMTGTLQAQEMGHIPDIGIFKRLYKDQVMDWKVWKPIWKTLRGATDFRESILRYANYIEYLEQIKASPEGMPRNFGASIPAEISGLKGLNKEMAYQLSNDLLGAYDSVSAGGQFLREYMIPFWSWKEVNMKRYYRFIKNAAKDGRATSAIGKHLAIKAPLTALRVGRAMMKISGMYAGIQIWNNVFFPEEEADLDENTRNTVHVILPTKLGIKKKFPFIDMSGRTKEGEVAVFTRVGALGDALEMFGLDAPANLVSKVINGEMSAKEVAEEMAKTASNVWVQALGPQYKIWLEVLIKRNLFPDVWESRPIRDVGTHVARTLAIENEYRLLPDIPGVIHTPPGKPYSESLGEFFYYHVEPYEAAYHDMFPLYKKFREQYGKGFESAVGSERSQALYWAKLAWRWGDNKDRDKYLQEYINYYVKEIDITGRPVEEVEAAIEQGLNASLMGMMPTAGMNENERRSFIQSLDGEGRRKLAMAFKFWTEVLLQGTSMSTEEILKRIVEPYVNK